MDWLITPAFAQAAPSYLGQVSQGHHAKRVFDVTPLDTAKG